MKKKMLAMLLACSMMATMAPVAFAEEGNPSSETLGFANVIASEAQEGFVAGDDLTVTSGDNGFAAILTGTVNKSAYAAKEASASAFDVNGIFDTSTGKLADNKEFALFSVDLTGIESSNAYYVIKQTNKALQDDAMTNGNNGVDTGAGTKIKNYSGSDLTADPTLLFMAQKGEDVTLEIGKVEDGSKTALPDTGVVKLTITNDLRFVKTMPEATKAEVVQANNTAAFSGNPTTITNGEGTLSGTLTTRDYRIDSSTYADIGNNTIFEADGSTGNYKLKTGQNYAVFSMPMTLDNDAYYVVKQTNPALAAYTDDGRVTNDNGTYYKTATALGSVITANPTFMVKDGAGPIKFEIAEVADDSVKDLPATGADITITLTNNVAFTDGGSVTPPPTPGTVDDPTFTLTTLTEVLGQKVADIQTGVNIAKDADGVYQISGTSKYVTGWENFNQAVAAEQKGHYVVFTVNKPENATDNYKVKAHGSKEKTFAAFFTEGNGKYETFVMRLDDLTDKKFTISFDWNNDNTYEKEYTFNVSGMTFAAEDADVKAEATVEGAGDSATAKAEVNTSISDAITAANEAAASGDADAVVHIDATAKADGAEIAPTPNAEVTLGSAAVTALDSVGASTTVVIATPAGTVELPHAAVKAIVNNGTKSNGVKLAITQQADTDAEGGKAYEVKFVDNSGTPLNLNVPLTVTLTFKGINNPGQVWFMVDNTEVKGAPNISYIEVDSTTKTYKFTVKVPHLSLIKPMVGTPPTVNGTITATQDNANPGLGKTYNLAIADAKDAVGVVNGTAYLVVSVQNASGQTCYIEPITLTAGAGNATVSIQAGADIAGAWVISGNTMPNFTSGGSISGVLAQMS